MYVLMSYYAISNIAYRRVQLSEHAALQSISHQEDNSSVSVVSYVIYDPM